MAANIAAHPVSSEAMTGEERKVIFASSLGTVFEWYDFYLYGSLAPIIGKQFFTGAQRDVPASCSRCSRSPPASQSVRSAPLSSVVSVTSSAASTPSSSPSC